MWFHLGTLLLSFITPKDDTVGYYILTQQPPLPISCGPVNPGQTRVDLGFDLVKGFTWAKLNLGSTRVNNPSLTLLRSRVELDYRCAKWVKWRNADGPGATKRLQLYWRTKLSRNYCLGHNVVPYQANVDELRRQGFERDYKQCYEKNKALKKKYMEMMDSLRWNGTGENSDDNFEDIHVGFRWFVEIWEVERQSILQCCWTPQGLIASIHLRWRQWGSKTPLQQQVQWTSQSSQEHTVRIKQSTQGLAARSVATRMSEKIPVARLVLQQIEEYVLSLPYPPLYVNEDCALPTQPHYNENKDTPSGHTFNVIWDTHAISVSPLAIIAVMWMETKFNSVACPCEKGTCGSVICGFQSLFD